MRTRSKSRPLTVLQSFAVPKADQNPYCMLLAQSLDRAGTQVRYLSWKTYLTGGFDIFHVHWPEAMLRHVSRGKTIVKFFLALVLLARVKFTRRPVVRTIHNNAPHTDATWPESLYLAALDSSTIFEIHHVAPESEPQRPYAVIPIGNYRELCGDGTGRDPVKGRLIAFGLIRAYKQFDLLAEAFCNANLDEEWHLEICGDGDDAAAAKIQASADDPRVNFSRKIVPERELYESIMECEAVVLPYGAHLNSSAAILALSLSRPVILTRGPAQQALVGLAGNQWVYAIDGTLDGPQLRRLLRRLRADERQRPLDLASIDWSTLAPRTVDAYRIALKTREPFR